LICAVALIYSSPPHWQKPQKSSVILAAIRLSTAPVTNTFAVSIKTKHERLTANLPAGRKMQRMVDDQ